MSGWHMSLRHAVCQPIDARNLRLAALQGRTALEVESLTLQQCGEAIPLGDLFLVRPLSGASDRLTMEGDFARFHHLFENHSFGDIHVVGSVGRYCASGMKGGTLIIDGNAGDFLGAPHAPARHGMSGGRLLVGGSAGRYAAYRMRRGELLVEGDLDDFAASHMVAGTVVVGGRSGQHLAFAMRRGSILTDSSPSFPTHRFTVSSRIRSPFLALWSRSINEIRALAASMATENLKRLATAIQSGQAFSSRGDAATQGQGELITPT